MRYPPQNPGFRLTHLQNPDFGGPLNFNLLPGKNLETAELTTFSGKPTRIKPKHFFQFMKNNITTTTKITLKRPGADLFYRLPME